MMKNEQWSRKIQEAAKKRGIETGAELFRKLKDEGLTVVQNTVWRWWAGHRKPNKPEQYRALDKVLGIRNSERLFFFER